MNDDAKKWIFQKNQIRNLGREIDKETQKLFWHKAITQRDGDGIEIALEKNFDFSLVLEEDLLDLATSYNRFWEVKREGIIGIVNDLMQHTNLAADLNVKKVVNILNSRIDNFLDYPVFGKPFVKYLSCGSFDSFPYISNCKFIDDIFADYATKVFNKVEDFKYYGDLVFATELSILNKCDQKDLEIAFKNGISPKIKFHDNLGITELSDLAIKYWGKYDIRKEHVRSHVIKCSNLKKFVYEKSIETSDYQSWSNQTQEIERIERELPNFKIAFDNFIEQNHDLFESMVLAKTQAFEVSDEL